MTREVIRKTDGGDAQSSVMDSPPKTKNEVTDWLMLFFQKQQISNLNIKGAMARELAAMGLSTGSIQQILHLEDRTTFKKGDGQ